MNLFDLIILAIAVITNLTLGSIVLTRNRHAAQGQVFLIFTIAISFWAITNYFTDHASTLSLERVFDHLAYGGAFLVLALMLAFAFDFTHPIVPVKLRLAFWASAAIGTVFSLSSLVVGAASPNPTGGVNDNLGPLFYVYVFWLLALFVGVIITFWRAYRLPSSNQRLKTQIKVIALGFGLSFILGILFSAVIPAISSDWSVAKFGPLLTVFMVGSIAYAIIRHHLFDIRLVVARSLAYLLLLGTLAALYGTSIFAVSRLFFTGSEISTGQQIAYVALAIILAFTFQPLRRFFERLTDRIFYRDRYDSQEVLNSLSTLLAIELNLERILRQSLERICQSLHIEFGQFVIFKNGHLYKIEHYGELPDKLLIMPKMVKFGSGIVVADNLEGGERKEIMEDHDIGLSAGLRTHSELVGYLLLGNKLSGNIYSEQDIELLQIAVKELAVAISNARAYEEIQAFNETLQEKVTHATNRLQTANRHLKELDKAKDEFISMASHQLRTPLTTIKGYLSMMLEGDTGKITADQRQFIEYAFDGSERMVSLISDLLNVSRLSAGRFVIEREPTDVVEMIGQEVRQLTNHAEVKGIALNFTPPKHKIPKVELDGTKTRQVIMNFIDNAIYYTVQGSVTVAADYDGRQIKVEVTDTGIGVPPAAQKHLFTKFFRADNAQQVRPDGTGLGLYLAKRVVEDQGGTIIFRTKEGQGSTFGFELPVKVSGSAPKKARTTKKKPVRKEAHVG